MSCNCEDCEWLSYRANKITLIHEDVSGECKASVKEELRSRIMAHLSSAVAKPSHVTKKCPDEKCKCFAYDKEPDKGWETDGSATWTETLKEGGCTVTDTFTYEREHKKVPGHCLDPMPTGPESHK